MGKGCGKGRKPSGGKKKVQKVMNEYAEGKLHSGSKTGPVVKKRDQAVAIALSEQRESDAIARRAGR